VDKVVPPDKLETTVSELAGTIASKSSLIIKLIKKTINRGMYCDLPSALSYEKSNWSICFATEDHLEGLNAFLEKRKAEFKGK
jgi:enoyl-CoA hydratase